MMSSSATDAETPDLVCRLDNVQGMVDALSAVRWKRHQVIRLVPRSEFFFLKKIEIKNLEMMKFFLNLS